MRTDPGIRPYFPDLSCAALLALLGVLGCQGSKPTTEGAAASSAASPSAAASSAAAASGAPASSAVAAAGTPVSPDVVAKVMNPKQQAPYSGPTGTLRGQVRIKGDPPPDTGLSFPVGKCGEAAATYGRLFRVGQDQAVADVLVTVVNYDGYVPEREAAEKVTLHGCALSRRTLAVSFGQRIEVSNLDGLESYMPYLDGAPFRAVMVAIPKGDAVKLYPQEPGHYMIRDQLPKPFLAADVFVLKFATHDVTGLDGKYEIKGIPVGKVLTAAFLPAIGEDTKKQIEIKEGDNTLDFELSFDLEKYNAKKSGAKR